MLYGQGNVEKVEEREQAQDDEKQRRWHIAAKDLGQAVSDLGTAVQAKEQARRWPHDELDKPDSTGWHAEALKR